MSDLCTPTFAALAARLGFSCDTAGGVAVLRSPSSLENWTLPVLELTVIGGAVLALFYAIIRLRRHNDPTNIVVWFGAIAYLLIIEPPLYFPGPFGISEHVDTMFAHNVFTVDFLWGRLPLYIIAIYPMMATVAFEIVRTLGVFRRYGVLVGAACVGLVHHAFYEIFDLRDFRPSRSAITLVGMDSGQSVEQAVLRFGADGQCRCLRCAVADVLGVLCTAFRGPSRG